MACEATPQRNSHINEKKIISGTVLFQRRCHFIVPTCCKPSKYANHDNYNYLDTFVKIFAMEQFCH